MCEECDYATNKKSSLDSHKKVHLSNPGMFKCDQCEQAFVYKDHLTKHVKNIHEDPNVDNIPIVQTSEEIYFHEKQEGIKLKCGACGKVDKPEMLKNHMKNICQGGPTP